LTKNTFIGVLLKALAVGIIVFLITYQWYFYYYFNSNGIVLPPELMKPAGSGAPTESLPLKAYWQKKALFFATTLGVVNFVFTIFLITKYKKEVLASKKVKDESK
jgi:hypothetical protein